MGIGGLRMAKKYRFRLSETNWVEFTQKELDKFSNVDFIDEDGKGKIIPVKRAFDKQVYDVIGIVNVVCSKLEQENKKLKAYKDVNEDFKKAWDELNRKYTEVLKLAKTNADSNEYCLQELEQKYEQLRSALEEILESAKFAQCLPCGSGNLEDCLNCDDDNTNNGQFCMEKRIHEIKTKCVEVLNDSKC